MQGPKGYGTKHLFSLVTVQMWPYPLPSVIFFLDLRSSPFIEMPSECNVVRESFFETLML